MAQTLPLSLLSVSCNDWRKRAQLITNKSDCNFSTSYASLPILSTTLDRAPVSLSNDFLRA